MIGIARAPGTCGELVQGKTAGINFLVTCPIDMYSVVTVKLNTTGIIKADDGLDKVKLAAEKTLSFFNLTDIGVEICVASSIPHGKGMASSTADITATCGAIASALGRYITTGQIADIALSIEPTDGIMFPGITLFDHKEGKLCRTLGLSPGLTVLIVDLGGTVDTLTFNANKELDALNRLKETTVSRALDLLEKALLEGDSKKTGESATLSSFANQHILYKPELEDLVKFCQESGGVGVNVAHSGTVVGLLYDKGIISPDKLVAKLNCLGFNNVYKAQLINGGVEVLQQRAGDSLWQPLDTYMEEICERVQKSTG